MDKEGTQQIVPIANQAMIEACSQALSQLMKALWADCEYRKNFTTKRNDQNGSWKDFSQGQEMTEYWSDPKNHEAHGEAMTEYWSDPNPKNGEAHGEAMIECWSNPKSTEQHERLSELMIAQWEAQPFNPEAKYHT